MLFALPGYQFPCIVMNRCLYLRPYCSPHRHQVGAHDKWGVHTETERIYLAFGPRLTFLGRQASVCCPSTWVLTTLAQAHHKLGLVIYVCELLSEPNCVEAEVAILTLQNSLMQVSESWTKLGVWRPCGPDARQLTSQPKGWCKRIKMPCTERRRERRLIILGAAFRLWWRSASVAQEFPSKMMSLLFLRQRNRCRPVAHRSEGWKRIETLCTEMRLVILGVGF